MEFAKFLFNYFRFSLRFVSDFEAFDPDILLSPEPLSEEGDENPVGETVPLLVTLDTCGEWEVIAATPETSSNASGFSAVRNGFRPGETFVCKVYVKRDNFEVSSIVMK